LNQLRKKKLGAKTYKNRINRRAITGKRSMRKVKKRTSETKVRDPGNPKNKRQLINDSIKSLGQSKFNPLNSVINLVLKRRFIASTKRKALEESRA